MRLLLAFLLVAASSAPLDTVQGTPGSAQDSPSTADAYAALVARYHAGDRRAVTGALAEWSTLNLQAAFRALPASLKVVADRGGLSPAAFVATAMVAHLDVARQAETTADLERHLEASLRLSDLLPPDDVSDAEASFKAAWCHAAGMAMFRLARYEAAQQQFEMARRLRPGDPDLLLALGSVHEIQGLQLLHARVERQEARSGSPTDRRQQSSNEHLDKAEELYRAALAAAPGLYEARLRLARVFHLQGRLDAADKEASTFDTRVADDHLRYLTLLIGGSISEAAGRSDAAIASYRDASALCRGCHSATLALSQILLGTGQRDVARDLVDRLVNIPFWPTPADPWLEYQMGQWYRFDAILDRLQLEVPA